VTRLPLPGEQQPAPPGLPIAVRWLPSMAALGRAPHRPGAHAAQVRPGPPPPPGGPAPPPPPPPPPPRAAAAATAAAARGRTPFVWRWLRSSARTLNPKSTKPSSCP